MTLAQRLTHKSSAVRVAAKRTMQLHEALKPKRIKRPEQKFQIKLVEDLALILTPATFFCHIPNGGYRTKAEAGILQAMGARAGAPDLLFVHEGRAFFMELKIGKRDLSLAQITCKNDLRRAGACVETVRNLDEALECLNIWGIPVRIKQDKAA